MSRTRVSLQTFAVLLMGSAFGYAAFWQRFDYALTAIVLAFAILYLDFKLHLKELNDTDHEHKR